MKAIGIIAVLLLAVFLVFATTGSPQFTSSGDGISYYTNGNTIFGYWSQAEKEATERERIEAQARTAQLAIAEEHRTQRHLIFWQYLPWAVLALTALAAVVGGIIAWILQPPTMPLVAVTVNRLDVPYDIERFARGMAIEAEYQHDGASWWIVDRYTRDRYQPPPQLARLPGPR